MAGLPNMSKEMERTDHNSVPFSTVHYTHEHLDFESFMVLLVCLQRSNYKGKTQKGKRLTESFSLYSLVLAAISKIYYGVHRLADRYIVIPLNQHHKQRTGQLRETGTMMASQSLAISCLERRINSQVICSRRWLLVAPITIHRESPHMLFKMFGRTFDEDCSSALQTESHSITTRHYALTLG